MLRRLNDLDGAKNAALRHRERLQIAEKRTATYALKPAPGDGAIAEEKGDIDKAIAIYRDGLEVQPHTMLFCALARHFSPSLQNIKSKSPYTLSGRNHFIATGKELRRRGIPNDRGPPIEFAFDAAPQLRGHAQRRGDLLSCADAGRIGRLEDRLAHCPAVGAGTPCGERRRGRSGSRSKVAARRRRRVRAASSPLRARVIQLGRAHGARSGNRARSDARHHDSRSRIVGPIRSGVSIFELDLPRRVEPLHRHDPQTKARHGFVGRSANDRRGRSAREIRDDTASPDRLLEEKDRARLLEETLAKLPPAHRLGLWSFAISGISLMRKSRSLSMPPWER